MTDLFGREPTSPQSHPPGDPNDPHIPLAERVRPRSLAEILGQEAVLGPGTPLRRLLESGQIPSLILWGPPGSGKTTVARVVADLVRTPFVSASAVLSGVPEIRRIIAVAAEQRRAGRGPTILFVDEIHRFNKAQQDAFLPHVEGGTIILLGATTENPSFHVNPPLLSRCRVVILEPLSAADVSAVVRRALARDPVLRAVGTVVDDDALDVLASRAGGDARRALNGLEVAVTAAGRGGRVDRPAAEAAMAGGAAHSDRGGEEHYNLLSALHKSLRNSDADAAVYWVVRMLRAGEDPLVVARRLVRFASEDVGLADPEALPLAVAAQQAAHFLGLPEGGLALVEAAVYLAAAPKSNTLDGAWRRVIADLEAGHVDPVPLALRNAPTPLMRASGYGRGYRYAHDEPEQVAALQCLPDSVKERRYYEAGDCGREKEIAAALAEWARRRQRARER